MGENSPYSNLGQISCLCSWQQLWLGITILALWYNHHTPLCLFVYFPCIAHTRYIKMEMAAITCSYGFHMISSYILYVHPHICILFFQLVKVGG